MTPRAGKKESKIASPQKIENAIEWLKQSRRTHDQNMLKMLITGYKSWHLMGEKLDESKFERAFKLKPLPQKYTITLQTLNRILNYKKVEDILRRPLFRESDETLRNINVRKLIKSLLPEIISIESHEENKVERESLAYSLSRILIDKIPKMTKLSIQNQGLDALSSAIISLFSVARATDQRIPWLYYIWNRALNRARIDSLEFILHSISPKSDLEDIDTSLDRADERIKNFRGQGTERGFFGDEYSKIISEDFRNILRNKELEFTKRKKELREAIYKEIATLKGFSTPLESDIGIQGEALTHWPILSLRADGPVAFTHESLLRNIRNGFNILRHPAIYNLCTLIAASENPNRPTANDLQQVSNIENRAAFYSIKEFEPLLTGHYIPSFKKIGLRYRYIFTPKQRPGVLSNGLIERMILLKKESRENKDEKFADTEPDIRGCTVHLEPNWSEGPDLRFYEKGTYEAVVEEEIISLNLDLFNKTRGEWVFQPREMESKRKRNPKGLLTRSTVSSNSHPIALTERQIELLSILWSIPMSKSQRKWLIDKMQYPQITANRMLRQLLQNETMRLLYLPTLELIGLPDGFVAMAHCQDRRSRETLVRYMQLNLPYSRILIGDANYVICHARVAEKKSDVHGGMLNEVMADLTDISFMARQRSMKTYKMTVLHRIRNPKSRDWIDPWNPFS